MVLTCVNTEVKHMPEKIIMIQVENIAVTLVKGTHRKQKYCL